MIYGSPTSTCTVFPTKAVVKAFMSTETRNRYSRQLPRTITRDQFKRLMSLVDIDRQAGRRDRCAFLVMYYSGLRVAETVSLVRNDVTETQKGGRINVRDGKGSKARSVSIPRVLYEEIDVWGSELPSRFKPLFPSFKGRTKGRAVSDRYLRSVIADLSNEAGILKTKRDGSGAPLNPHILRHSYATEVLSRGMSLKELQHQLGHASIVTTQIYLHIQNDQLDDRISTVFDDDRHVDPVVAESQESSLDRVYRDIMGEVSPQAALTKRQFKELVEHASRLSPERALRELNAVAD